jgi:hypothetical protein
MLPNSLDYCGKHLAEPLTNAPLTFMTSTTDFSSFFAHPIGSTLSSSRYEKVLDKQLLGKQQIARPEIRYSGINMKLVKFQK